MGLLGMLRRRPRITDSAGLAHFIDQQAAFITQKGIYEYSRARAGHYAKVLMTEPGFLAAVELSRWQAYPLGIAMVTEMVEGVLRAPLGQRQQAAHDRLSALALAVFDRYAVPAPLGEALWRDIRHELARRLAGIGLHAPKPAKDIPEPFAEPYFALMPIHEKLRGRDFATTRNYLRIALCNIHDELTQRMDAAAVVETLIAEPSLSRVRERDRG
jgi:hypothetical protein